jgi:hypothetical protein
LLGTLSRFVPSVFMRKLNEPKEERVEKVLLVVRSGIIEGMNTLISYVMMPFTYVMNFVEDVVKGGQDDGGGENGRS